MSKIDINEVRGQLALLGVELLAPVGHSEEGLWFLALKPKGSRVYYLVELREVSDGLVSKALIIWSYKGETYQVTTACFGRVLADSLKKVAETINEQYSTVQYSTVIVDTCDGRRGNLFRTEGVM